MVSRRNYVVITIVMLVVVFLFQFSQVAKSVGNNYATNKYSDITVPKNNAWKATVYHGKTTEEYTLESGNYILFLGDESTSSGSVVSQWVTYTKRNLFVTDDYTSFSFDKHGMPEFVVVDSEVIDCEAALGFFEDLANKGISIVFNTLPSNEVIEGNDKLRELLGISYIKEETVDVEGIKLFSGFLLGGEKIYQPEKEKDERRQDLDLTMPWYVTSGGTKTYMVGLMDEYFGDYEYKNDYLPAIIWRNSLGDAQVFCVCGDYMKQTVGIGLLSSMIYELSQYQVYPIVNAQNTLLINYPIMSDENTDKMQEIYSRKLSAFQTDVIWPTLISLAEKDKLKFTAFMTPKYDYSDESEPSQERYISYLSLFNERDTEVGMSMEHADGIDLLSKLDYDKDYYDTIENRYPFTSAFMDLKDVDQLKAALNNSYVKNVRTIACAEDINIPILGYLTEDITLQSLTSNTENFSYSRDLMLKSVETALGYDNAELNFSEVAWPESAEDHWENIYDDMSSSLATFWKPFRVFDRTTLTESDQRVRLFLNLGYETTRENNRITIKVTGRDNETCWFIFRTHFETVNGISGAECTKIEDDAYLLTIHSDTVVIDVASSQSLEK